MSTACRLKAGERRVIEIDARRAGSAIDPVIRVVDGSGKLVARSEDNPLLQLDARLDLTFAKEGFYYVEVHDARYSTQAQNFYRLKTGAYTYATEIFPLGGRRGENSRNNALGHQGRGGSGEGFNAAGVCQPAGFARHCRCRSR